MADLVLRVHGGVVDLAASSSTGAARSYRPLVAAGAILLTSVTAEAHDVSRPVDLPGVRRQPVAESAMLTTQRAEIDRLARLPDDWDGEDAPAPSEMAVRVARDILAPLAALGLDMEIDADVTGGVSFTLYGTAPRRSAWVACMNSGVTTVVLNKGDGSVPDGFRYDDGSPARIRSFLRADA